MKLSLAAAALLGQSVVPVLSKHYGPFMTRNGHTRPTIEIPKATFPQSPILEHEAERQGLRYKRRFMRQVTANLKNAPSVLKTMILCDPKSTDADIGILSCGKHHICEPSITSSLGGVCTALKSNYQGQEELGRDFMGRIENQHPSVTTTATDVAGGKECNPSLIDIGILGCEEGQFCKDDATLALGGFCVASPIYNNRRLETYYLEDMLYLCEPWPAEDPYGICDCSDLNMTTGTGSVYCSQNTTASLIQGCDEYVIYDFFTYTFKDSVVVEMDDCYVTKSPYTEKLCLHFSFGDTKSLCSAEWNDQPCTSCVVVGSNSLDFDCSNVDGGPAGNSLQEVFSVIELCSNSTCTDLCGEGSFIPDFNFGINVTAAGYNYTCGDLAFYEENVLLADAYCPYFIEAAQSSCCVPQNSTSPEGDSPTPDPEPTNNTTGTGTTIPVVEDDEDEDIPSPPEDGTENDGAYQTIASLASMLSQAAAIMVLVNRV